MSFQEMAHKRGHPCQNHGRSTRPCLLGEHIEMLKQLITSCSLSHCMIPIRHSCTLLIGCHDQISTVLQISCTIQCLDHISYGELHNFSVFPTSKEMVNEVILSSTMQSGTCLGRIVHQTQQQASHEEAYPLDHERMEMTHSLNLKITYN